MDTKKFYLPTISEEEELSLTKEECLNWSMEQAVKHCIGHWQLNLLRREKGEGILLSEGCCALCLKYRSLCFCGVCPLRINVGEEGYGILACCKEYYDVTHVREEKRTQACEKMLERLYKIYEECKNGH